MKKCNKCGIQKELERFPKARNNRREGTCKDCYNYMKRAKYDHVKERERKKKQKAENPEKYREIDRLAHIRYRERHREEVLRKGREYAKKYAKKKKYNKEVAIRGVENWKKKNPEKHKCHMAFHNATRSGKLKKPEVCMLCGEKGKVEGHHYDYSKPFDVVWCCKRCHADIHRRNRLKRQS